MSSKLMIECYELLMQHSVKLDNLFHWQTFDNYNAALQRPRPGSRPAKFD